MAEPTHPMATDRVCYPGRIVSSERITPPESEDEVRELVIDIETPAFEVESGQSIGLRAPDGDVSHTRLYSVADRPAKNEDGLPRLTVCVRRFVMAKSFDHEEIRGTTSNFLCDLHPGDRVSVSGPYGIPFRIPPEDDATLILIGAGTGIAPFRAFVKNIVHQRPDWKGRIWLFHGARTGLEMLYMNDQNNDLSHYFDRETFEAFKALSPGANWADPIAWDHAFAERGDEICRMLGEPHTYVYVAGLASHHEALDRVIGSRFSPPDEWPRHKAEMTASGHWIELLY